VGDHSSLHQSVVDKGKKKKELFINQKKLKTQKTLPAAKIGRRWAKAHIV
jgi:hypothetical protein